MVLVPPISTRPRRYDVGRRLRSAEVHMCPRSPDMAKMDPSAADVALSVWNGSVHDPSA